MFLLDKPSSQHFILSDAIIYISCDNCLKAP